MKKLAILSPLVILMASTSLAQDSCIVRPSCADMGYTKTIDDCSGKTTLKCPFDLTAVSCEEIIDPQFFEWKYKIACSDLPYVLEDSIYYYTAPSDCCFFAGYSGGYSSSTKMNIKTPDGTIILDTSAYGPEHFCLKKGYQFGVSTKGNCFVMSNNDIYKPKEECEVGDYYYSDDTCANFVSSTKTRLGVVFDEENKLVFPLKSNGKPDTGGRSIWSSNDYTSISNYTSNPENDLNGLQNTINGYTESATGPFKTCYERATGGKQWYVPSAGEIIKLALAHNEAINTPLIGSSYIDTTDTTKVWVYLTSTEYDKTYAWAYNPDKKKLEKVSKATNNSMITTRETVALCIFTYKD